MRLLIYGSKDFAKTVAELIRHCGHEAVGMIDDFNDGPGIIGSFDTVTLSHPPADYGIAVAIGYSDIPARWTVWEKIRQAGYKTPSLIHPHAYVSDTTRIGDGVMIMARAIVDVRADISDLVVLWPGACINHDAWVGSNAFISPNATLCGFSRVGAHSFIGAGTVVADHARVPESSFIKMLTRYTG